MPTTATSDVLLIEAVADLRANRKMAPMALPQLAYRPQPNNAVYDEQFVGMQRLLQPDIAHLQRDAILQRPRHDPSALYPRHAATRQIGGHQPSLRHHEQVAANAFDQMSLGIQQQSFGKLAIMQLRIVQ